jgi:hypothetical protein
MHSPPRPGQPEDVSLVQLIANPDQFDGKLLRVIGFFCLQVEGDALYLHREDYEYSIFKNGISVDVTSPEITSQRKALHAHYVLLEGVFNSKWQGHQAMWSGSLMKIRRAMPWRSRSEMMPPT